MKFGVSRVQGLDALGKALCDNTTLTRLDLTSSGVGPGGAAALCRSLGAGQAVLATLLLDECPVGDDGAAGVADALRRQCTLRELSMQARTEIFLVRGLDLRQ